ncbi:LysR family transcriptional regulator, hca operon transcriptional activator [Bradyrhizobium erythrophlei]|jgi:LysR family hca operon transcriptional activator|uniref:LysR family transcriptional regulator, hca operon transcriptional activator n=2 Tax=Bradyrhizobium erythrophlei TaxID=1437360 RepID=A0A1M7T4L3_9BRAD|nr:LysR family transcriptional regulator [Bradyrhizobium erythrophlei]SHN65669.1 LysR family transcriptional regulator, hca operon transcriptional activator [Bradyrhizobium erythrophlei]
MELRHLRYFVAIAESGSFTVAAKQRLNTAQPSLSRQIRELEAEVGVQLLIRSRRGIELTAAGRAFLDHARIALDQAEAGREAARKAARPAKPTFVLGFLTGQEMDWLPEAINVLRDELPKIEITVLSKTSPWLAEALTRGKLDLAFMRAEPGMPSLMYQLVTKERLVVVLPRNHRLALLEEINPRELADENFITVSSTAPTVKAVIDEFISRSGVDIHPVHEADNLTMAMTLVVSTGGVCLLPAYAEKILPVSVISRPLAGEAPTIDLVVGYSKANTSQTLQRFLSRVDDLISKVDDLVPRSR